MSIRETSNVRSVVRCEAYRVRYALNTTFNDLFLMLSYEVIDEVDGEYMEIKEDGIHPASIIELLLAYISDHKHNGIDMTSAVEHLHKAQTEILNSILNKKLCK